MNRMTTASALVLVFVLGMIAVGQTPVQQTLKDEIPEAAMLTERGNQLATRLRWLRNAESKLGPKHPSLPDIKKQIADVKEELKAWAPGDNPFHGASTDGVARKIPKMNDEDLRQLVLRLTNEVRELKNRVEKLERRR